jgi:hypothetical protein
MVLVRQGRVRRGERLSESHSVRFSLDSMDRIEGGTAGLEPQLRYLCR